MALKAISLYTGVGGLDFGFEAAGFRTAVAVESDPAACRAIELNRRWQLIPTKIQETSPREILAKGGLRPGDADVLIGGPPCQPFSKSGYWASGDAGRLQDERANTLEEFLKVLEYAKPKAFLLENVRGLAYRSKDEGFRYLLRRIAEINRKKGTNYKIDDEPVTLNAAEYGVPQNRERVFLVGSREGIEFNFPAKTHRDPLTKKDTSSALAPFHTAWDAIGDLDEASVDGALKARGKWAELLPSIPEGQNYLFHTKRGGGKPLFGWRTRYWSFLLKLAKNRPSWTLQAQPGPAVGPFHWKSRYLSSKELARLQTFPEDIRFDCSHRESQRMLGNAVPSLLAEVLAWEIRFQLLGQRKRRVALKLMPQASDVTPKPERVRPVPKKFLEYIGDHQDHPGTGKGPNYQRIASESVG